MGSHLTDLAGLPQQSYGLANGNGTALLDELLVLAAEQAALRRVAERVAHAASPEDVFGAVTAEVAGVLGEPITLMRFEGPSELVVVAVAGGPVPVGERIVFERDTLPDRVARTGRPARADNYALELEHEFAARLGLVAAVAAPVVAGGQVWGMLKATSGERALPTGTEDRLAQFAELVGAAVVNADSRAELAASRARVIAAADETRRRLQRDVHDGAQQRLVQTLIALKLARDALNEPHSRVGELIDEALRHAELAATNLRDVVQGILPTSLHRGGLGAGIQSLVTGLPLVVDLDLDLPRFSRAVETTAYFVVAEALTNVVKHAQADWASVKVSFDDAAGELRVRVRDDGIGGADARAGTGLTGLSDRVAAADGSLTIISDGGRGTTLDVRLPARAR